MISRLFSLTLMLMLFLSCTHEKTAKEDAPNANPDSLRILNSAVRDFLTAAERGDSAKMLELIGDRYPLMTVNEFMRDEPELVRAALEGLTVKASGPVRGDTIGVVYSFPYKRGVEHLGVTFLRDGQNWRIFRLGLPRRM